MHPLAVAFILTTLAGLATSLGAAIAFFARSTNFRFLSVCTGLSAGVMLFVSFVEIYPEGVSEIGAAGFGERSAAALGTLGFFLGIALIFLIDRLVPSEENPHEPHSSEAHLALQNPEALTPEGRERHVAEVRDRSHGHLLRMGIFTALAIGIHNFPEGLATFLTSLENPELGVPIALAIALHNIPEGISVSVPIYYATGSRTKAFVYSCLSGLAEPIGAAVVYFMLAWFYGSMTFTPPPLLLGMVSAGVAGIMVFISIDELLPASREYGKGHDSIYGLLAGMLIMALSLIFL